MLLKELSSLSRGPVSCIYSDNDTNFQGAKTYLNDLYNLINSKDYMDRISHESNLRRIQWKMIPPRAPYWWNLGSKYKMH